MSICSILDLFCIMQLYDVFHGRLGRLVVLYCCISEVLLWWLYEGGISVKYSQRCTSVYIHQQECVYILRGVALCIDIKTGVFLYTY